MNYFNLKTLSYLVLSTVQAWSVVANATANLKLLPQKFTTIPLY